MTTPRLPSRRAALSAGFASLAAVSLPTESSAVPTKAPGETRVVYFGGDYAHNGIAQEHYLRETFSASGWRIFFAQASRFITPQLLAGTDLLMMTRTGTTDVLGYSPEGLVDVRPEPDPLLPPPVLDALIDNIRNRGMGFLALHCTAGNPQFPELMELIGVRPAKSGAIIQPVRHHDFDPDHPITRGFTEFEVKDDENLKKEIVDPSVTLLFKSTGVQDGVTNPGGWCVERGKGRIVVLLAGHSASAWSHPRYRELHWRAAHWAMHREIPEFGMRK